MISAGQYNPYAPQGANTGYPPGMFPGGYPGGPYGGMMAGPSIQPMLIPSRPSGGGGPSFDIGVDAKWEDVKGMAWAQYGGQTLGQVQGTIVDILNYNLASNAAKYQKEVAIEYYDTQEEIGRLQRDVAFRQMDTQEYALEVQERMHRKQMDHELALKKLEGLTQERIKSIEESYKNKNAELFAVIGAFGSRRGWDMGLPFAQ